MAAVYVPIPLSLNSAPSASPRFRINDRDHVAAALIPAGNTEFRSAGLENISICH